MHIMLQKANRVFKIQIEKRCGPHLQRGRSLIGCRRRKMDILARQKRKLLLSARDGSGKYETLLHCFITSWVLFLQKSYTETYSNNNFLS